MNSRRTLTLFLAGLLVSALMAYFINAPGYMDADYYFAGGQRLAAGQGFSQAFLWNFLDDPSGIPHPSHTYWMPLTSIVAAAGISFFPFLPAFRAAQVLFVLLAALVPPLTAALAYSQYADVNKAMLAGWLALFPGFYLVYYLTTDAFLLYTLLGGLFFWRVCRLEGWLHFLELGLLAGLLHMARADGILWLLLALAAVCSQRGALKRWQSSFSVIVGYLSMAGLWLIRNCTYFGSPLSPGGGYSLWLLDYDELFIYPASLLTFDRWRQAGAAVILGTRWQALLNNLQTAAVVQGLIFLGPLALLGAWQHRKQLTVRLGAAAWGLTFVLMTLIFPYSGWRGGFFHSAAALMPLVWLLAPVGLAAAIKWMAAKRGWVPAQAWQVLRVGLVGLAALLTIMVAVDKLGQSWDVTAVRYQRLEEELLELGAAAQDIVMVNNPPAYYVYSSRQAVVIPHGDLDTVRQVAQRYQIRYLILDQNNSILFANLMQNPHHVPGMRYLASDGDAYIFLFEGR